MFCIANGEDERVPRRHRAAACAAGHGPRGVARPRRPGRGTRPPGASCRRQPRRPLPCALVRLAPQSEGPSTVAKPLRRALARSGPAEAAPKREGGQPLSAALPDDQLACRLSQSPSSFRLSPDTYQAGATQKDLVTTFHIAKTTVAA